MFGQADKQTPNISVELRPVVTAVTCGVVRSTRGWLS
jgi:hypothetical protein